MIAQPKKLLYLCQVNWQLTMNN